MIKKRELVRLNMNMPKELLDKVDEYANKMNITRSTAINVLISKVLESNKN